MKKQFLKKASLAAFALVLTGGMAVSVEAQVDNTACLASLNEQTTCANQTITRVSTNAYQLDTNNHVRKVLLYDNAAGHPGGKAAFRRAVIRMAMRYGFELVISDAAIGYITPTTLTGVDVVLFSQGDRDVVGPQNSASENALADYIYRMGKSMLMVHASAAFITCPGTGNGGGGAKIDDPACHFMARAVARQYLDHVNPGSALRIYGDSTQAGAIPPYYGTTLPNASVGSANSALPHGRVNLETKNIFNNALPGNWTLPPNSPTDPRTWVWDGWADEHYSYYNSPGPRYILASSRNFNGVDYTEGRLNVILTMDEGVGAGNGNVAFVGTKMVDHPVSWVRHMGFGLAAYANSPHDNSPLAARAGGGRSGNDSVFTKYAWNLIRFLAHDYAGCMDPAYNEYKPAATVTSLTQSDTAGTGNPCKTLVPIAISAKGVQSMDGISLLSHGMRIALPEAGIYRVLVTKINGEQIFAKPAIGGSGRKVELSQLGNGLYVVQVTSPGKKVTSARVLLD